MEPKKNKLTRILLIDDDEDNNFIHNMIIKESGLNAKVISVVSVTDALAMLNNGEKPDLIFLDINMPVLNGWDFLIEYKNLPIEKRSNIIIAMLTSSINISDERRAREFPEVAEYKTKPLTREVLKELSLKYF